MKRNILAIVAALALVLVTSCTESFQRDMKNIASEYTGGLNRSAKVYASNGEIIAAYEGKFDVQSSEFGNKVLFDVDGKRVIIYNAIVIIEEF